MEAMQRSLCKRDRNLQKGCSAVPSELQWLQSKKQLRASNVLTSLATIMLAFNRAVLIPAFGVNTFGYGHHAACVGGKAAVMVDNGVQQEEPQNLGLSRRSMLLVGATCLLGRRQPATAASNSVELDGGKTWMWSLPGEARKAAIRYFELGPAAGRPVVLIHGFGASAFQWRALMPILADRGYHVFALDLLGLGMSEKPGGFAYSMLCWQRQVEAFLEEVVGASKQPLLVGNSLGSLIALNVAENSRMPVCLLNCGGGMNFKCVLKDGYNPAFKVLTPLFVLSDVILKSPLLMLLFNTLATREKIREILSSGVYRNPSRVDDNLVESFYAPSQTPGALEAFESILTGDPGESPLTLAERLGDVQMLVLWGNQDTVTPLGGPVGQYFVELSRRRPATVEFVELAGVGHCPMDDAPSMVQTYILPWLQRLEAQQKPYA